jgi:hypothetical protein
LAIGSDNVSDTSLEEVEYLKETGVFDTGGLQECSRDQDEVQARFSTWRNKTQYKTAIPRATNCSGESGQKIQLMRVAM